MVVILASVMSEMLLYFLLTSFYESQSQSSHVVLTESWEQLGLAIALGNLVALLLGSIIAVVIVLYRSHKIVGPLYRFCRVFEQIGQGQLKDMIPLRKHDELREVAVSIEIMIEGLKQQRQRCLQVLQTIQDKIEKLKKIQGLSETKQLEIKQLQEDITQLISNER